VDTPAEEVSDDLPSDLPDDFYHDNKDYIQHAPNGQIVCVCSLPYVVWKATTEQLSEGCGLIEGTADPATEYILNKKVTARPDMQAVLEGLVVKNLPVPCALFIDGNKYDCTEDHAELEFDAPRTYKVTVIAFPYLDKEFEIENQA